MEGQVANLYRPGQGAEWVEPKNGTDFQLEECYQLLDCRSIELLFLRDSERIMIIDEEGKLKPNPVANTQATVIAKFENSIWDDDVIVGAALICKKGEIK
jgi:hypothetical protein